MDVGVIGVGQMGRNHARVYSELKDVGTLYIYDINQNAARELAERHGAVACESLDQLLKKAEAVSICVPTPYHFAVAEQVIRQEIPLLIEKPICTTAKEAGDLIRMIPEGLVAGVGHIERFNPVVNEIRRIIQAPLYVEMKRHNPSSARVSGSTVVEDLMIHDIDIVRNVLFPGPFSLTSVATPDICSALFTFEKTPVYLSASRKSSKKIRMIYIEEEDRTIEGDFMNQEIFVHRKPGQYSLESERYVQENIIEKVLVNKVEPLKVELQTFLSCVRQGREFPITPAQALTNLEICEQIARCN